MKFLILAASLVALVAADTKNFAQSCSNIRVVNGRDRPEHLEATCGTGVEGATTEAELALHSCLGNFNGKLEYANWGNHIFSCSECALSTGTTVYTCVCEGGDTLTAIDLNTIVGNEGGKLVCGPP